MSILLSFSRWFDWLVVGIGRMGAWLILPLVAVIVFDVVTRKIPWFYDAIATSVIAPLLSSALLQELEWHLHAVLVLLVLGYAYSHNAHVRIDLLREKLAPRGQAWVEFIGLVLFFIPSILVFLYYGWSFVEFSYVQNERSNDSGGLGYRWVAKAFILIGFSLALLSGLSILFRKIIYLFGPSSLRDKVRLQMLTSIPTEPTPVTWKQTSKKSPTKI